MESEREKDRLRTFIVTSPKLAGRLIFAKHEVRETVNPFSKDRMRAWEITLDDDAVELIREYYDEINRPVPKVIERWPDR